MRDFEERKAEIFRRSERRIAQRRRRKRVIISCIPLVICIAVLSVIHVPNLLPATGNEDNALIETNTDQMSPTETQAVSYSSVKVQGRNEKNGYYKEIEEPENVEKIVNTIEKYNAEKENAAPSDNYTDSAAAGSSSTSTQSMPEEDAKEDGYKITVVSSDGREMVYTIIGDCLSDLTNGKNVFLTESQLYEISSLLTDSD